MSVWTGGADVPVATDLLYGPEHPVEVVVRKHGWRFDETSPESFAINVNRRGVVFVQSNEARLESARLPRGRVHRRPVPGASGPES